MATVTIGNGVKTLSGSSGDSLFIQDGSQIIDTAVDQSALANGYVDVEGAKGFTGDLGTSGNPFYAEITDTLWWAASSGTLWHRCKTSGDATPKAYFVGPCTVNLVTGGTITAGSFSGSQVIVHGPFTIVSAYITGGKVIFEDDTSTDPTLLHMMTPKSGVGGGVVHTERGFATGTNECGQLTIEAGTNVIGTLNCLGTPTSARTFLKSSGTITRLNATGHVPDVSGLNAPVTITDTTINMTLPGSAELLLHPQITFTNAAVRVGSDGRPL